MTISRRLFRDSFQILLTRFHAMLAVSLKHCNHSINSLYYKKLSLISQPLHRLYWRQLFRYRATWSVWKKWKYTLKIKLGIVYLRRKPNLYEICIHHVSKAWSSAPCSRLNCSGIRWHIWRKSSYETTVRNHDRPKLASCSTWFIWIDGWMDGKTLFLSIGSR